MDGRCDNILIVHFIAKFIFNFSNKGGVAHGPRGPKSFFFMEEFNQRILGLRTALTVKFHQVN